MEKDLSNLRLVYERGHLLETEVRENPMEQFQQWFLQAQESESEKEPNAMSVATIGLDDFPKTRVVLLKKFTDEGFIFYTNYNSEKGKAIAANPHVVFVILLVSLGATGNHQRSCGEISPKPL